MEGDLPTFVLRLAGLVVALFIMYALTESRFGRATTFVAFVGGVALIALGNFAVFWLAGPETFLRFYPLTGNVAAFALLLGIARQRPLVVAFTILTAIQLNAVIGMLGHAASLTVDPTRALAVNLAVRAVLAVPLVWATFRFFRPYYLEAARTMRRGWGLLCLIPLAFYALFYLVYIVGAVEGEGMRIAIVMLALAMALAGYAIVFVALREHARRTRMAEAQRLLEEQARAFERQIEAVRASDEKMRVLRHDLRHHLGVVSTLVRAGKDEQALAALGGVDEAVEEAAVRRWCENEGVNASLDLHLVALAGRRRPGGVGAVRRAARPAGERARVRRRVRERHRERRSRLRRPARRRAPPHRGAHCERAAFGAGGGEHVPRNGASERRGPSGAAAAGPWRGRAQHRRFRRTAWCASDLRGCRGHVPPAPRPAEHPLIGCVSCHRNPFRA